jgi:hypothetical protein
MPRDARVVIHAEAGIMGRSIAVALVALLSGACSFGRSVVPAAFKGGASFAIVNVNSAERISYSKTTLVTNSAGGLDTGGTGFDAGPAAGIFPRTKAAAVRALASARRFRLVPEHEVLATTAYASTRPHPGTFYGGAKFIPAHGYKLVFDEAAAGRIARAAGAGGALIVNLQHGYTSVGGGHVAGKVVVMVTAVDRAGRKVWTDFAAELSERTLSAPSLKVPPSALEPLLVDSTERGMRVMLARLDEQLRRWN